MKEEKEVYFEGNNGEHLIPVHINKCRDDKYFWNWSSDAGKWIREEEIPEHLNRMYKNPKGNSDYNK